MSAFTITPATRQGIIPLLALWGGTGSGKTRSALMLARGMAGNKKLGVIDTEGRRASYYSDLIDGGFEVINFDPPYTPERYVEALALLESKCDVGVLDSATHLWDGPDGILDLHEQALDKMTRGSTDWKERERLNWPAWREPKMRYKAFRSRILAMKIPMIVCFRGEEKTHMERQDGKNVVITDKTTSPVFDKKMIFEFHVAIEVFQKDGIGGYTRYPMPYAKTSHPTLRAALPPSETEKLDYAHGKNLIDWCNSTGKPVTQATQKRPAAATETTRKWMLEQLSDIHMKMQAYAIDNGIIMPDQGLDQWPLLKVPTSKTELAELRAKIEAHQ